MPEKKHPDEKTIQIEIRDSILNSLDLLIYVSDMVTNEILFANVPLRQRYGDNSLTGKTCWEALRNESKRCENCPIPYLLKHPGESLQREMCVEGGRFQVSDSIIPWANGKLAHLQYMSEFIE